MDHATRRQHAKVSALVAGILLLTSGTVGSTALAQIGAEILRAWLPFLETLIISIMVIVSILAGLGGFTVLTGAYLITRGEDFWAKVLITIGVGTGILGLALHLVLVTIRGENPAIALVGVGSTMSGIGVLLSIYARQIL